MERHRKLSLRSFGIVAIALSSLAQVGESAANGFYFGAAVGDQSADHDWGVNPVDIGSVSDDLGYKIMGGFRVLDPLAIEVNYASFGSSVASLLVVCPALVGIECPAPKLAVDASALSVSAVGILGVGPVDLIGRAGLTRWESDSSGGFGFARNASGTDPTFGIGLQFHVRSYAIRLELERFDFSKDRTDVASMGFTYGFQ
jgi:hypothetical protein